MKRSFPFLLPGWLLSPVRKQEEEERGRGRRLVLLFSSPPPMGMHKGITEDAKIGPRRRPSFQDTTVAKRGLGRGRRRGWKGGGRGQERWNPRCSHSIIFVGKLSVGSLNVQRF